MVLVVIGQVSDNGAQHEHQDLLATEHLNEEPQEGPQEAAFVTISEGFNANAFIVKAHGVPAFNGIHGDLEEDQTGC